MKTIARIIGQKLAQKITDQIALRAATMIVDQAQAWNDRRRLQNQAELEARSDQGQAFSWVIDYLREAGVFADAPILKLRTIYTEGEDGKWGPRPLLSPGPGQYLFSYQGQRITVTVEISESSSGDYQVFCVKLVFPNTALLQAFSDEAYQRTQAQKTEDGIAVRRWNGKEWSEPIYAPKRRIDSVVLREGQMEELLGHIEDYETSRELCARRGIPHRTGVLLEGPPGTGKSSLVRAVAGHLDKDVFVIDIKAISEAGFVNALRSVPQGHIIFFEDIDAAFTRDRKEEGESLEEILGISLKGILNGLDGLESPEHVIYFMTTNHVERLDAALIRPGRVDLQMHLGRFDAQQGRRLFDLFFPEEPEQAAAFGRLADGAVPSEVQNWLKTSSTSDEALTKAA